MSRKSVSPWVRAGFLILAAMWATVLVGSGVVVSPVYAGDGWTPTGPLNTPCAGGTSITLPNGQVLYTGGWGNDGITDSVEIWDPVNKTWVKTTPLNNARKGHSATLLRDGRVMVIGGMGRDSKPLFDCEIFDPYTKKWIKTSNPMYARTNHKAVLLYDGRILVTGGQLGSGVITHSCEMYTPDTNEWTYTTDEEGARMEHTMNSWAAGENKDQVVGDRGSRQLPGNKVIVAGGIGSSGTALNSAEIYDPDTVDWTETGPLNAARSGHQSAMLADGRVLVVGGKGNGTPPPVLSSAELYDWASGAWKLTGPLKTARSGHTLTRLYNGMVLVVGGEGIYGQPLSSAELYNPATGTWTETGSPLNTARKWHSASLLANGGVLVAGGVGASGLLDSAEIFQTPAPVPFSLLLTD